jgi:hypothetical protein
MCKFEYSGWPSGMVFRNKLSYDIVMHVLSGVDSCQRLYNSSSNSIVFDTDTRKPDVRV